MNRRFLLVGIFKKTFALALLITLFGGINGFAQSGYGDFIFFEDFGRAVPRDPGHEYYRSSQNNDGGAVYFRKEPLADITSLLFYIPSSPPDDYGVPTSWPLNDRLNHENNWGPQFRFEPEMGSYSVVTNSRGYRNNFFHSGLDHTQGDGLGYMLLVDAYSTTGLYFERDIEGLCAGTKFEFSAWIKDVNIEGKIQPRIRFEIYSVQPNGSLGTRLLDQESESGYPVNEWREQRAEFVMPESVSKIRLRISNAVDQEQGNDIAIDDIGFRPMGPGLNLVVSPQAPVCVSDEVIFTANIVEYSEAYSTNHFILQRREIGSTGEWENVGVDDEDGGIKESQGTDPVEFIVNNGGVYNNYEYRVVVAGDPTTLNAENCRAVSDPVPLTIYNHEPELSVEVGNSEICANESVELSVAVTGGVGNPVYTYVWEKSIDGNSWETISGETSATLNSGSLTQTTYYRVTARVGGIDGCPGAGASDIFEVRVNPTPDAPTTVDVTTYIGATGIEYNVTALPDHTLIWYEDATGTAPLSTKPIVSTEVAGAFTAYVAQQHDETGCIGPIVPVMVFVKRVELSVEKTVDLTEIDGAGQLEYTITIENTGEFDLTDVVVSDILKQQGAPDETISDIGNATQSGGDATNNNNEILEVGETWTYTFVYAVDQAQIDNGADLTNTVTVTTEQGASGDDEATTTITQTPSVSVDKSVDQDNITAPAALNYTITVENTGNISLTGITVTDAIVQGTDAAEALTLGTPSGDTDNDGILDVGETWVYEVSYAAEQPHIDNGNDIVNTFTFDAEELDTPASDEAVTTVTQSPSVTVEKIVDQDNITAPAALNYTITVENTGNVSLTGITVTDAIVQGTGAAESLTLGTPSGDTDNDGILDVGETWVYEVSYTAEQPHIDNGGDIVNTFTFAADELGTPASDDATTEITRNADVQIEKTADRETVSEAGEVITYTLTVTNTGNVTLRDYTVTDVLFPGWSAGIETLAPKATRSFELEYTVTQADIDNGGVVNVASVVGENPGDPGDEDEVEVPSDKKPGVEIEKAADRGTVGEAGETITYTITVTNTGNVTLRDYTVTDVLFPGWSAGIETLAPKATRSFELEYEVTQADIDNGGVVNVASVVGENPGDPGDEDEVEVPVNKDGSVAITKVADRESFNTVGDVITYTITITNTGNVTLSSVVVTDVLFPDWSENIAALAPKATRTFELIYTVRQSDVDNGRVLNVAHVKGEDPDGGTPEDKTEIEVPGAFAPVANSDEGTTQQGEPITITVLVNDEAGSSPIIPESVRLVEPGTGNKVTMVTIEGEGTYTVDAAGKVIFTPDENFVGNSTITYTVKDENGLESNVATIAIIVEGVAAEIAPNAVDDTQTTPYGQPVTIDVLNNDVAGSSPIVPSSVTLIDGSGNRVNTVMIPGEGRYEVNAQGTVTFTPADGFTGASTIQYEITDENGLVSNPATITVTVNVRAFKIPNVFTPNGDGRNDVFEIVGIEGFDRVEITVVNRWGNEVYRNNNYRNNWDGQGLNEGTYYYVIITHDGGRQERYAGWVLIKKQ